MTDQSGAALWTSGGISSPCPVPVRDFKVGIGKIGFCLGKVDRNITDHIQPA